MCGTFHVRNKLNNSIWRQNVTHCLHCRSWLNTGSFPDDTASCNGVLKKNRQSRCTVTLCTVAGRLSNPIKLINQDSAVWPTCPCCSACWGWLRSWVEPLQFVPCRSSLPQSVSWGWKNRPGEAGFPPPRLWLRSPEQSDESGRWRQIHHLEEEEGSLTVVKKKKFCFHATSNKSVQEEEHVWVFW